MATSRHSALVRATHWITALCFLALLVSGIEIVISHPRFYWGETGNILTTALCDRERLERAFPDQPFPDSATLSWRAFATTIASHLRFARPSEAEA